MYFTSLPVLVVDVPKFHFLSNSADFHGCTFAWNYWCRCWPRGNWGSRFPRLAACSEKEVTVIVITFSKFTKAKQAASVVSRDPRCSVSKGGEVSVGQQYLRGVCATQNVLL